MRCNLCGLCGYGELRDEDQGEEDDMKGPYKATPRWKAMMRKASRKLLEERRPSKLRTFRYDAVSYAMNFDEQGLLHRHQF